MRAASITQACSDPDRHRTQRGGTRTARLKSGAERLKEDNRARRAAATLWRGPVLCPVTP